MRQEFIDSASEKEVWEACPWASIVVKVEGGYHAYEDMNDYYLREDQK